MEDFCLRGVYYTKADRSQEEDDTIRYSSIPDTYQLKPLQ